MLYTPRLISCAPLLLGIALVLATPLPAAGKSREEAAKSHYLRGAQLYRQADYAGAWLEFTSAYQLSNKPELLFNMARCEVKLGRHREALAHFKSYLEAIPNDPDAEGIRKEIADLEVKVSITRKHEQAAPREGPFAPPPPAPGRRPFPVYGTIAGVSTLLLGVVGVSLLGSVSSKFGDLNDRCAPSCARSEVSPLEQEATAGYVFLGLTAVGAIATTALLIWEIRKGARERPRSEASLGLPLRIGWRF